MDELNFISGDQLGGVFPRSFDGQFLVVAEGDGHLVWDEAGNEYIDAISSSKNVNIGHGVDEIADAAAEQMRQLEFIGFEYTNRPAIELCSKIGEFTPENFEYTFLVSSGSEAIETAIKMARQYHIANGEERKYKVISRRRSYHGMTIGAMATTGIPEVTTEMEPLYPDFPKAPAATPYRCERCDGTGGRECGVACAEEVERIIRDEGPENVSAFLAEPVTGDANAGASPHEGYFERVREICDKYDVLLVVDEMMTGFGRTGKNFGIEHWDVTPDVIISGKGMASGYTPIAGVIPHDDIVEVFKRPETQFAHGHTSSFNPTSAAIARAVLQYVEDHDLVANARETGAYLRERLEEMYEYDIVGDVRGKGMLQGIEFVSDEETKEPLDASKTFASTFYVTGLRNGILTSPASTADTDTVLIAPPLTIDEAVADEIVERLKATVKVVERKFSS